MYKGLRLPVVFGNQQKMKVWHLVLRHYTKVFLPGIRHSIVLGLPELVGGQGVPETRRQATKTVRNAHLLLYCLLPIRPTDFLVSPLKICLRYAQICEQIATMK